jgi:hypothetical protein
VHFSFKALILRAQSARKMSALSPFVRVARATPAPLAQMGCSHRLKAIAQVKIKGHGCNEVRSIDPLVFCDRHHSYQATEPATAYHLKSCASPGRGSRDRSGTVGAVGVLVGLGAILDAGLAAGVSTLGLNTSTNTCTSSSLWARFSF